MDQNAPFHQPKSPKERGSGSPENTHSLRELGSLMRQCREERGLSLTEISSITKVQIQYLEELEKGQLEKIPRGIYRTGYLRSYLEALNEDPAPWTGRFEELSGTQNQRGWVSRMGTFLSSGGEPRMEALDSPKQETHRPKSP